MASGNKVMLIAKNNSWVIMLVLCRKFCNNSHLSKVGNIDALLIWGLFNGFFVLISLARLSIEKVSFSDFNLSVEEK